MGHRKGEVCEVDGCVHAMYNAGICRGHYAAHKLGYDVKNAPESAQDIGGDIILDPPEADIESAPAATDDGASLVTLDVLRYLAYLFFSEPTQQRLSDLEAALEAFNGHTPD